MVNIIPISSRQLHEGYLMVDHRASPGTPQVPEGTLLETATMHCAHCGTVVIMNPNRTRERAFCQSCNKYICDNCGLNMKLPDYVHKSYKQQLDESLTLLANKG